MNLEKQSQIKTLIARGKEKGYLTYAEVTDHLPEIVDSEQLDDVISMINSMGIVVHDEAPDEESLLLPEPPTRTKTRSKRRRRSSPRSTTSSAAPPTRCACTCARWARSSCSTARARSASPSASRKA
jgi:hypothetical protein